MILISDLDRTLIYSKKSFINEYYGDYICVEKNNDKEITYVTPLTLKLLKEILLEIPLIPCTMRSFNQTMRVDFIREMGFNTCICSNGAEIYIKGQKDLYWESTINSYIDKNTINSYIKKITREIYPFDVEVRNILGYYIEIRCKDELSASKIRAIISNKINDRNLNIFSTTNKVFVIDKRINKESAVTYLKDKLNLKNVISSGDADVDLPMLLIADYSIAPKHKSFEGNFNYITKSNSILAGEEIVKHLISLKKKEKERI